MLIDTREGENNRSSVGGRSGHEGKIAHTELELEPISMFLVNDWPAGKEQRALTELRQYIVRVGASRPIVATLPAGVSSAIHIRPSCIYIYISTPGRGAQFSCYCRAPLSARTELPFCVAPRLPRLYPPRARQTQLFLPHRIFYLHTHTHTLAHQATPASF